MKTRLEEIDEMQTALIRKFIVDYKLEDNVLRDFKRYTNLEVEKNEIMKSNWR